MSLPSICRQIWWECDDASRAEPELSTLRFAEFTLQKGVVDAMPLLEIAILIARLFAGAILTLAGLLKLQNGSHRFLQSVLAYDLVQGRTARLVANGLPWLEIICGLFLITGFFLPITALVGYGLLMMFTVAVTSVMVRKKQARCGCFGATYKQNRARWQLVYRNLGLMGLTIIIFGLGPGWLAIDSWLQGRLGSFIAGGAAVQNSLIVVWLATLLVVVSLHLWQRYHLYYSTRYSRHMLKGEK